MNGVNKQVIQTGGGGSGTPWGADTQIQFNDRGAFGWDSTLTFDRPNATVYIGEENGYWWIQWTNATTIDSDWSELWIFGWQGNWYGAWWELFVQWWWGWDRWDWGDLQIRWGQAWGLEWNWGFLDFRWWQSSVGEGWYFQAMGGQWAIRWWPVYFVWGASGWWLYGYWWEVYFEWGTWEIAWNVTFTPWYSATTVTNGIATFAINGIGSGYAIDDTFTVDTGSVLASFIIHQVDVWGEVQLIRQLSLWSGYSVSSWVTTTNTLWTWTGLTIDILTLVSWGTGKIFFQQPNFGSKIEVDTSSLTADRVATLQDASGTIAFLSQIGKDEFWLTVDWAGAVVTTGSKWFRYMWYDGTITGWNVTSDVSWSIVFDIKRSGASIAGTEKPTLSSQSSNSDLTLTTWTTAITAWDELEFIVDSASTITRATLTILITKS